MGVEDETMPGGSDLLIGMERTLRDKEVQCAHLMAVVYEEQTRTQDKQDQVLRLDAERLELGRKLAEMESIKRLHIAELEARNRAMQSELDTARMELDNKIREKRELMQAHAAYIEEMERQHANRVDELDTLGQQYRGKIWSFEAKIEGLEKQLDQFKDAEKAHHPVLDLNQFSSTGEEDMDAVLGKNEALLAELESAMNDLGSAEGSRDSAQQEAEQLRAELEAAQAKIAELTSQNEEIRNAPAAAPVAAPVAAEKKAPVAAPVEEISGDNDLGAPSAKILAGSDLDKAGVTCADLTANATSSAVDAANAQTTAHYDDLRKKLLHTCVSLLEEFDDKRCQTAHDLLEQVESEGQ